MNAIGNTILDLLSIQFDISCGVIVVHPAKESAWRKRSSLGSCCIVLGVDVSFRNLSKCEPSACSVVMEGTLLNDR